MKIDTFTIGSDKQKQGEREYPWVGIHGGMVVAFSEPHCGTVINKYTSSPYTFGDHRTDWLMHDFAPYNGELKIVCKE